MVDGFIKQSTAVTVKIGKFVDSTDGNTAENELTITQSDILLSKNGGALTQKNEASNTTVDGTTGFYDADLDTTDTNTLGLLKLVCHMAGALYVSHTYQVVTANVYNTLCSTDLFQTDLTQIGGVAQSATDLKDFADAGYNPVDHKVQGVVLCDTTTTNSDMVSSATIEAACDASMDNAIGGAPTAGSIAERIKTMDDAYTAIRAGYIDELAAANLPTDVAANLTAIGNLNDLAIADVTTGVEAADLSSSTVGTVNALAAAAVDSILDEVVDAGAPANCNSLRENINVMASILAGKSSGGGTNTLVFRDLGDTKARQTETVDADGNRTAATQDGT